MQKSRLIEHIAELLQAKKLPLLADVDDEFAEDIRVVIEPNSRTVEPAVLMEQLFKLTELEARVPLNMNVLSGQVPRVLGLAAGAAGIARSPQGSAAPAHRAPPRRSSTGSKSSTAFSSPISISMR